MKKINLKFLKHPTQFRLGYHAGENGVFEEKQAKELIAAGVAVPLDEPVELPEDLPGRNVIAKAGLSLEELKEVKDFMEIKGVTKKIAENLTSYFNSESK